MCAIIFGIVMGLLHLGIPSIIVVLAILLIAKIFP